MSTQENNAATETTSNNNQHRPPVLNLVDADCNLWHDDLKTFLLESIPSVENQDNNDRTGPAEKASASRILTNPWHLLQQDDTSQISAVITPCSTMTESRKSVATLQQYSSSSSSSPSDRGGNNILIRTTLGIHPYHVNDADVVDNTSTTSSSISNCIQELRDLYDHYQQQQQQQQTTQEESSSHNNNWVVAIGECGLDRAPGFPEMEDQLPWFRAQIQLAQELQLPLYVHERLAFDETMQALECLSPSSSSSSSINDTAIPVLIHCFTGNAQQLKAYLHRGYYISLAGGFLAKAAAAAATSSSPAAEDPTITNAQEVVQALPQLWWNKRSDDGVVGVGLKDRLLLETDAPYMGFANGRSWYLQKHATAIQTKLTSKKRKRLQSSTYPNVPSSLEHVLDIVHSRLTAVNGDGDDDGDANNDSSSLSSSSSLTREELAQITTANAERLFGFSIRS